eukprot:6186348-Pleurochrysis_carterae.AAC.2
MLRTELTCRCLTELRSVRCARCESDVHARLAFHAVRFLNVLRVLPRRTARSTNSIAANGAPNQQQAAALNGLI